MTLYSWQWQLVTRVHPPGRKKIILFEFHFRRLAKTSVCLAPGFVLCESVNCQCLGISPALLSTRTTGGCTMDLLPCPPGFVALFSPVVLPAVVNDACTHVSPLRTALTRRGRVTSKSKEPASRHVLVGGNLRPDTDLHLLASITCQTLRRPVNWSLLSLSVPFLIFSLHRLSMEASYVY